VKCKGFKREEGRRKEKKEHRKKGQEEGEDCKRKNLPGPHHQIGSQHRGIVHPMPVKQDRAAHSTMGSQPA
jgi:hypothetical protein